MHKKLVRATIAALQSLRTAREVADLRDRQIEDIVGKRLAEAYRQAEYAATDSNSSDSSS